MTHRFPNYGPLSQLMATLRHHAQRRPDTAVVAELPRGAFVRLAMVNGRREIRIGRTTVPAPGEGLRAWSREVDVFRTELRLGRWTPMPCTAKVGIVVGFLEPETPDEDPVLL